MGRYAPPGVRFEAAVNKNGPVPEYRPELGPCWLWTTGKQSQGYGMLWVGDRQVLTHRFSYELHVGPIPDGLELDHLCRVRACVNPRHLEPVTHLVNARRGIGGALSGARQLSKTHCPSGHPYDLFNTSHFSDGSRRCKTCHREKERARLALVKGRV